MAAVAALLKAGYVSGAAVADDGEVLGRHRENYPVASRSSGPHDDDLTDAVIATVRALRAPGQRSTVGLAFEPVVGHVPRLQHALEHVQEQVHLETAARRGVGRVPVRRPSGHPSPSEFHDSNCRGEHPWWSHPAGSTSSRRARLGRRDWASTIRAGRPAVRMRVARVP